MRIFFKAMVWFTALFFSFVSVVPVLEGFEYKIEPDALIFHDKDVGLASLL